MDLGVLVIVELDFLLSLLGSWFFIQVFDLMRKQEKTRLAELAAENSHYEAIQAHNDIVSNLLLT